MAKPFVCVPKNGSLGPEYGYDLGARGYRLTFDNQIGNQPEYLRDLLSAGLETYLTCDSDSFPGIDWNAVRENPWDESLYVDQVSAEIAEYRRRYAGLVSYLNCGNEFDGTGDESSRMPVNVVNEITRMWAAAWPDVTLVAASSVSGAPSTLAELDLSLVSMIDLHLYAKMPSAWGEADPIGLALNEYKRWFPNHGICLSEIGWRSDEGGEEHQATYCKDIMRELIERDDVELVSWYALHNWASYGLLNDDGSLKLAYHYYRDSAQYWHGAGTDPEPKPKPQPEQRYQFVQGFKRIDELYPELLGEPLENEQTIVPGLVTQRTARGQLTFARISGHGDVFTFTNQADGYRGRWFREDLGI